MTRSFDFDIALEELKAMTQLTGESGILTPLIKKLTEAALLLSLKRTFKK